MTAPDPALTVECPHEGGCGAPAGTPCYSSYGDGTVHAERTRLHALRSLEHGTCALCARPMVRGTVDGEPFRAWHPDPAHHDCPPMPDPVTDWNGYALTTQQGLLPGHPGLEHFLTAEVIEHANTIRVHGSGETVILCPECANGKHPNCDSVAMHPVTDELVPCTCDHGATS